ncbi:hypothetical protein [Nocardioides sp. SYSU DS0651]|uniref:hypothetical protein n=1 Tax=Nocardioides sp. SYSU DS0651 TaxID=3415955 RepID=UPI003F4C503A
MSRTLRAALAVPSVLLGAVVATCTVLLHGYWWGMALGLAATLAALVALPAGWWARLAFAAGWAGLLVVVTPERPEGDFLIAGDTAGYLLLGAGIVVFAGGFAGLRPPRRTAEDSGPASPSP